MHQPTRTVDAATTRAAAAQVNTQTRVEGSPKRLQSQFTTDTQVLQVPVASVQARAGVNTGRPRLGILSPGPVRSGRGRACRGRRAYQR